MLGVGLSSVLVGWYSDNYGRRLALMYCVTTFGLFTAAVYWSRDWFDIMVLRFIAGLGLGGAWGVITAFINETWPKQTRGRAVAFVLSSWPIGYIVAAYVAQLVLPEFGWRVLFLFGGTAIVVAIYIYFAVPESEKWLAAKNERMGETVKIGEIFLPETRKTTLLGTLAAGCALTGYWGANTWLPTYLMNDVGLSAVEMTSFIITLNIGMFFGYQILGWLADRLGQRNALLICFVGASVLLPTSALQEDPAVLYWFGPIVGLFFAYAGPFTGVPLCGIQFGTAHTLMHSRLVPYGSSTSRIDSIQI